jgi:hypothetical protein
VWALDTKARLLGDDLGGMEWSRAGGLLRVEYYDLYKAAVDPGALGVERSASILGPTVSVTRRLDAISYTILMLILISVTSWSVVCIRAGEHLSGGSTRSQAIQS